MKKRHGNMAAIVVFIFTAIGMLSGALMLAFNQQQSAQQAALSSTRMYSMITTADMAASAFTQDLEGMTADGIPSFTGQTVESYSGMASAIKSKLFDGSNVYLLKKPEVLVTSSVCTIGDESIRKSIATFLKSASMTLTLLDNDITINRGSDENIITGRTGDIAALGDIHFAVTLNRGTDTVRQTYCLSGLTMQLIHNAGGIHASINGNNAKLTMEGRQMGSNVIESTMQTEG